jgi:hypothetical protein
MAIQKKWRSLLIAVLLCACGHRKHIPDVSQIPMDLHIDRFDQAFFALDTNQIAQSLRQLQQEFPYFCNDFTSDILGAAPLSDTNTTAIFACHQFLVSYLPVKDSLERKYPNLNWLEKDLDQAFRFIRYYFPQYNPPPHVVAFIGPFDAPGVAITRFTLAIGLQLYAGHNFAFYNSMEGQELYPAYISRRFERPYIPVNCMKAIAEDMFPDSSANLSLIGQIVEKGKYWWLTDLFLPRTEDSLKTGFSQKQLDWCQANEGLIWNYVLQHEDLYNIDPDVIKNYIGDSPSTPGMPDISPGNIGQWIGWKIVEKYVEDHPEAGPKEIMRMDPRKLFEESKYKPR